MGRKRHRIRRKEIKKKRIKIIISLFAFTLLFTFGYAAFSAHLSINAKGNIKMKAYKLLKSKVVTSGDGLYADSTEQNRYVYKGASPDNYICLESGTGTCSENNLYRIISLEADNTLKVIKNKSIGDIAWDPGYTTAISGITEANSTSGTRYSDSVDDFCYYSPSATNIYGCKAWGSRTSTYDSTGNNHVTQMTRINGSTSTPKNLPEYDSYINVYLNGGTYPTLTGTTTIVSWLSGQNSVITGNIMQNHIFYIGGVKTIATQSLQEDINQEKAYTWKGSVGFMNITDFVRANTNTELCGSVYLNTDYEGNNYEACKATNWLSSSQSQWSISCNGSADSPVHVLSIANGSYYIHNYATNNAFQTRPAFFLKPTITLTGSGTNDSNVYRIT